MRQSYELQAPALRLREPDRRYDPLPAGRLPGVLPERRCRGGVLPRGRQLRAHHGERYCRIWLYVLGDESAAGTGHGGGACRPTARHALVRPLRGGHPPHGAGQYHRLLSRAVGLHLHGGDPQRQKPEIRHGAERHALGSGRGTPRGAERGQWGTGHGALPSAIP